MLSYCNCYNFARIWFACWNYYYYCTVIQLLQHLKEEKWEIVWSTIECLNVVSVFRLCSLTVIRCLCANINLPLIKTINKTKRLGMKAKRIGMKWQVYGRYTHTQTHTYRIMWSIFTQKILNDIRIEKKHVKMYK